MAGYFAIWLVGLLALCHGALADSCANVTISNAADADAVRKNCRVIQGSLIFGKDLSESINLDGIEVVEGSIGHFACEPAYEACTIPKPFTISSSTLTTVNKSIDFWYFHGLEKLVLPNLTTVGQFVLLERLHNVTHLDLTQLSYIGAMVLETRSLKTLLLDGLQGFTGYGVPYVEIWNSGQVESVDGFFTNPLNVSGTRPHAAVTSLTLDSFRIPNVRTVTIGWAKLDELYLSGVNLTVILGGPSTESMEFREVSLGDGIVGIERNPKLKNLTATTFGIKYNKVLESLTVPFDQLSNFSAIGSSLRSVELPVEAERWQNLSVDISLCPALNLSSEFAADGAGKSRRTWYWPQEDMRRVSIFGEVANAFFDSFIQFRKDSHNSTSEPRVLEEFDIQDTSGDLDCSIFSEMHQDWDILSDDFWCETKHNSAGVLIALQHPWHLGLLALGILVPLL